jgi:hypothetical protein
MTYSHLGAKLPLIVDIISMQDFLIASLYLLLDTIYYEVPYIFSYN